MKNEHDANLGLTPQTVPSWMHPSKHVYKPLKAQTKGREYLGAIVIGLIIAAPFIVQTITDYTK